MSNFNNCMAALRLLSARKTVSMGDLMSALGSQKRTVIRTIEDLRTYFRLEIEGLRNGGYRLKRRLGPIPAHDPVDQSFMVPGLMLSANEAYDLVRLLNATGAIDPGLLATDSLALRGLLKQMLAGLDYKFRGANRKLRFELPQAKTRSERAALLALSCALKEDEVVSVRFRGQTKFSDYSPQYLVLTPSGWEAQLFDGDTGDVLRVPIANIENVESANRPAVRQPGVDEAYEREERAILAGDA